jgi:hypothetical protein
LANLHQTDADPSVDRMNYRTGDHTKLHGHSAGVLQGSVLSPLLYSIYLDPLVEVPSPSLPYNDGRINCFLYADDIALVAHSAADLNSLLAICEEDSLQRGYRFSPAKCVVVSKGQT